MSIEVTMPRLSDTMEVGTVVKWNVKEGQPVKSGDVVADIETDKATMELQSFDDGTVEKLAVPEGKSVKVGTVIMTLSGEGGAPAKPAAEQSADNEKRSTAEATGGTAERGHDPARNGQRKQGSEPDARAKDRARSASDGSATESRGTQDSAAERRSTKERAFASPLARKIAAEQGVDLSRIEGTGPSGRIVRKDVEAARGSGGPALRAGGTPPLRGGSALTAAHVPATPEAMVPPPGGILADRTVTLSNMRRIIAKRLVESKTTIPHYQVTVEADMDALLTLRTQLNAQLATQGVKLSVNDFLVRACALAMHQHPFVNSRWIEGGTAAGGTAAGGTALQSGGREAAGGTALQSGGTDTGLETGPTIRIIGEVNIGIAIALPEDRGGGLVVGTIRGADRLGLRLISHQSKSLSEKARAKGLSPEEMSDSTFTISNLGMFGVEHFTAIINPPNVAILAVGAAVQKPVVRDGQLTVGHRMAMTMSSDHRVVDGAMAAAYLATVREMLEKPATLLV
ncbi:MAG: 2-oxo acid dehydrogenase subunit E2 [Phycisphaerales bacterium]|nr:2-oxo acid dehydrogenase subunit E2 [Phycisphaerales bacterium]